MAKAGESAALRHEPSQHGRQQRPQCDNIMVMYGGQMMEYGTPENIFENSAHPYTIALRESIPDLHPEANEAKELQAIKGLPPNLMKLPKGCPFGPRCSYKKSNCENEIGVRPLSGHHELRCTRELS